MSDYQPIACGLHSEYELLAMQRARVMLRLRGDDVACSGRVIDILTREGAEFMVLEASPGERREVRLDQILEYDRF